MKLSKCRSCNSNKLKKLLSLGNMCFTGKFPKGHKCIEKCDQVKLFEYLRKKN